MFLGAVFLGSGFMGVRDAVVSAQRWKRIAAAVLSVVLLVACAGVAWFDWSSKSVISPGLGFVAGVVLGAGVYARQIGARGAAKVVAGSVLGLLAAVGIGAVLVAWALAGWLKADEKAGAVDPLPSAGVIDCRCSVGAECVGPRGGRYCVAEDGKKKYSGK